MNMKTNQKISGGFDLNTFVGGGETTEPKVSTTKKPIAKSETSVAPKKAPKIGRPKTPVKEQLTQRAQVRMTEQEWEKLNKAAGLVPISAYLRQKLQEAGVL